MEEKKLPLSSDIVFKSMFVKNQNKDLLKSLIEAILKIEIEDLVVLNPEIRRDLVTSKAGVLDVKVRLQDDTIIAIEMQANDEGNTRERNSIYLIKEASESVERGEDYLKMDKTILINIMNFNCLKRNGYLNTVHLKYEPNNEDTYVDMGYKNEEETLTDKVELKFFEIPKYLKVAKGKEKDILTQWMLLISGKEREIEMSEDVQEKIKKAMDEIKKMNADPKEWELYKEREWAQIEYNTRMNQATKKRT